jgi:hypothetical protein
VRLALTGAGRELQRQVGRRHARSVARALTGALDRGELRQLESVCLKLGRQPATASAAARVNDEEMHP